MRNTLRAAPNHLTLMSLCIVPLLVSAVLDGSYKTGFVLFLIAGITAGLLARHLHERIVRRQYLDPVADKPLRTRAQKRFTTETGAFLALGAVAMAFCLSAFGQSSPRDSALALEQHGQIAAAQEAWHAVASADPKSAEAFAHLGLIAALQQRFDEAISYYIAGFRINPDFPQLEMNLGLALYKAGHFKESLQPFSNELRKHPGDPRLTILLGMAHFEMGDYLVAIPYLKRAVEAYPKDLPMRMKLAESCLRSRQPACVLEDYQQVMALHAESADFDMLAGQALNQRGDDATAVQRFRSAVQADPKQPFAHFALGYLYWKQGHFDAAAQEFQAELINYPQQTVAGAYLADCYLKLKEPVKAQAELEKLLPASDLPATVYRDTGIVYSGMGRKQDAIEHLRKAIALDSADEAARQELAKIYQSIGKIAEANAQSIAVRLGGKKGQETVALADLIEDAQARP